mmetsp:Transcript_13484/g.32399  ORF Transcript_13484/g.32399 Transcript_13484/m.32399 type:complete len:431 (-) Transcript_13484:29-1321(-)
MGKSSKRGQHRNSQHVHHKQGEGTHAHHKLHEGSYYKSHHKHHRQHGNNSNHMDEPLSEPAAIVNVDDDHDVDTPNSATTKPVVMEDSTAPPQIVVEEEKKQDDDDEVVEMVPKPTSGNDNDELPEETEILFVDNEEEEEKEALTVVPDNVDDNDKEEEIVEEAEAEPMPPVVADEPILNEAPAVETMDKENAGDVIVDVDEVVEMGTDDGQEEAEKAVVLEESLVALGTDDDNDDDQNPAATSVDLEQPPQTLSKTTTSNNNKKKNALPIHIQPRKGMAVIHHNTDERGQVDASAMRGLLPLIAGSDDDNDDDEYFYVAHKYIFMEPVPTARRVVLPALAAPTRGRLPNWIIQVHDLLLQQFGQEQGSTYFDKLCIGGPVLILALLVQFIVDRVRKELNKGSAAAATTSNEKQESSASKSKSKKRAKRD